MNPRLRRAVAAARQAGASNAAINRAISGAGTGRGSQLRQVQAVNQLRSIYAARRARARREDRQFFVPGPGLDRVAPTGRGTTQRGFGGNQPRIV